MPNDPAGPSVDATQLPSPSALLRAFGHSTDQDHPVLEAASCLAHCHARRRTAVDAARDPAAGAASGQLLDDIDDTRATLIARIDDWVAGNVAHRSGASLHTETLGAVIDRMAEKWIAAQQALGGDPLTRSTPRLREARTHMHWCRLAELTDGYRDLITDVTERRRRLPVW
ncbi:DUF4254 domain-containing protein [Nocardia sp. NPDC059177]|uniref:DUF4254 domain-containing protein n=1 Tax=Nocardia sp. NPDC059177 TaxID=3346759 RepID=UPI0036AF0D08